MKTRHNALFAFLATLVLFAGAQLASADVQDNAGFFSEDAVRQANFDLKDIKQKYGKDLLVETLPTLPAEVQSQINAQNKDKVYAEWAQQRGRDAKLDGVIVLITREPSHLQIGVGNKTQQKAFSLKDRDRLRDQMLTSFRQKQYDQALLNAIRAVHRGDAFLTNAVERSLIREWMSDAATGPDEPLSPREQEVLKLIAEAHTNKQIAEILHLAEKTVESHRANLLRKLGMRDRVELVRYAIRRGLTEA